MSEKNLSKYFLDENEVCRVTEPTDIGSQAGLTISDCATMITSSDLEIESCQLTGGSCSCEQPLGL